MSYLGELLEAGVRCYQYEKGFIHSKTLLVDGCVASVGTANMDIRSFDLNFEVNAFLYDGKFTKELEAGFQNDKTLGLCPIPRFFLSKKEAKKIAAELRSAENYRHPYSIIWISPQSGSFANQSLGSNPLQRVRRVWDSVPRFYSFRREKIG